MIHVTFVTLAGAVDTILAVSDEEMLEMNTPDDLVRVDSVPPDFRMRWNGTEWVAPG